MPGTQTQQLSDELAQRFPSANRGSGQIILTTGDGTALTEEQKQAFSAALSEKKSEKIQHERESVAADSGSKLG